MPKMSSQLDLAAGSRGKEPSAPKPKFWRVLGLRSTKPISTAKGGRRGIMIRMPPLVFSIKFDRAERHPSQNVPSQPAS
jgi:hypothetical protein